MRVLVAEDDALLREILCDGLADQGFSVEAAEDGQGALKRFRAGGPFVLRKPISFEDLTLALRSVAAPGNFPRV